MNKKNTLIGAAISGLLLGAVACKSSTPAPAADAPAAAAEGEKASCKAAEGAAAEGEKASCKAAEGEKPAEGEAPKGN